MSYFFKFKDSFKLILSFFIVFSVLFSPLAHIYAQNKDSGLVPCGTERTAITTDENGRSTGGEVINPCDFGDVIKLINNVVNFILKNLAVPLAAVAFFYAGILLLFSGGDSEKKSKAKKIFTGVAIGLVFVAASYLIVSTVLSIAGYKWDWTNF